MIIKKLNLEDFGKFHNETIHLQEGINILYGPNEAGKSTIHSFIRAMLTGNEKPRGREGKEDIYSKYLPWETPLQYQGSVEFEDESGLYILKRNFHKDAKRNQIVNQKTGRNLEFESNEEIPPLAKINKSSYQNTISVEQLRAVTDKKLGAEIQNYITNLASTNDSNIDLSEAVKHLKTKKKEVEYDATVREIEELSEKIEKEEEKMLRMEELKRSIREREEAIQRIEASIQKEKLDIPYKEVYNSYNNYLLRKESLLQAETENEQSSEKSRGRVIFKSVWVIMLMAMVLAGAAWYLKATTLLELAGGIVAVCLIIQMFEYKKRGEGVDVGRVKHHNDQSDEELLALKAKFESALKVLNIRVDQSDMQAVMHEVDRMQNEAQKKEQERQQLLADEKIAYSKLIWERDNLSSMALQIKQYEHRYEQLQKLKMNKKQDLEAIEYALDCIEDLAGKLHDEFSYSMNNKLSEYICEFTEGHYEKAFLDEDARIQLFSDGKLVKLEQLSVGTIHQIYLALRIVAGECLYHYEDMPIILDDYFAYYDDKRLECALKQLAKRKQVLIFSCHEREYEILEKLNIKFHLVSVTR